MSASGSHLSEVEPYLADRVRQPYPAGAPVLPGSTPVVSFGDVRSAWVATLGINPSDSEFMERGRWLEGPERRFESLGSLGLERPEDADPEQVAHIVEACYGYFRGPNPYWTWFRPLQKVLSEALGASYLDGSAAHLDLIQWATQPVWGKIADRRTREQLIGADREFLRRQLSHEGVRLVLMNSRRVMTEVARMGVPLEAVPLPSTRGGKFEIRHGHLDGTDFVGWNLAYPNGGISRKRTQLIIDTVRQLGGALSPAAATEEAPVSGRIERGTTVASKSELAELLRNWLGTGEKTIGNVGAFGGKPWIRVNLPAAEVVLNADTKRSAVQAFVDHTRDNGPESQWRVIPNARGTVNKVVFSIDGSPTEGWYAYTTRPQAVGTVL